MSTPDPAQSPPRSSNPEDFGPPDSYGLPDLGEVAQSAPTQPFPESEPPEEAVTGTYELDPSTVPYEPYTPPAAPAPGSGPGDGGTQVLDVGGGQAPAGGATPAPAPAAPAPAAPPPPPPAQNAYVPPTGYAAPQAPAGYGAYQAPTDYGATAVQTAPYAPPTAGYGTSDAYGQAGAPQQPQPGTYTSAPPPWATYPATPGYAPYGYPPVDPYAKSRVVAGVLGILLGGLGIHRFYLGYVGVGIAQIVVTILTFGVGAIWGFVEGILYLTARTGTYSVDATGRPLRD